MNRIGQNPGKGKRIPNRKRPGDLWDSPRSPFLPLLRIAAVLVFGGHFPARSFAAEYLSAEQVPADSANELLTPLDALSADAVDATSAGLFGREVGSYLPVLADMFSDSVLKLEPRFYYFYSSIDGIIQEEAAYGGKVSMTTGQWRDFLRVGWSTATSQALYTPEGRSDTGLLQRGGGGYWTPGEAWVEGEFGSFFTVKAFRQELDLPYFNRNDSRMTPRVHEAYILTSDTIPGLFVGAGHISKIKNRTSDDFISLSDEAGASGPDRGATLVGFRYQWRDDQSSIGALNATGWDTFNTFYSESTHRWDLPNDFEFNFSTQLTHQISIGDETVGSFETYSIGGRAALSYDGLVGTVSYTSTDEGAEIRDPWGGNPGFNSIMISDFDRAGENAWRIGLSYPFGAIGLPGISVSTTYVSGDTPETGAAASRDQDEFNINLDIRPEDSVLEDFWLRFRFGRNEELSGSIHETFRVILNYSRDF